MEEEEEAATTSSPPPPPRRRRSGRSTEPWLWVIEYLSIFPQIPTSLLHDVIEAAPQMPDEDGKTTMEMVALRCLEDLFTRDDQPATHSLPRGTTAPPFGPSLTCDAALQDILQSKSLEQLHEGGADILGSDIRPFIRRKRASMPKCTLQLLRDGALGVGSLRPCTASLAEETGVLRDHGVGDMEPVHSDDRNLSPLRSDQKGNEDGAPVNGLRDEDILPYRKRKSSLVDEEALVSGDQDLSLPKSDDEEHDSPRAPMTEEPDVLRSGGNENGIEPDYLDCRNTRPAKRDRSPSMDGEQDISDAIDDCRSKVKRLRPDLPCTTPSVQQVSMDGLDISRPRKASDSDADPDANHKIEHDQNHKHHASTMPEDLSIDEEEVSMEHNYAEDTSFGIATDGYHHLRIDVAKVKDRFLSSRCTSSDDYLATADWVADNLCTKCNLDGQLLVCSTIGCPLVVHENCLGSSPKYMSGNFYCPFCAYSLAISELEEALKKASLARKKLTAFIHAEPPSKGCSRILNSKDDSNPRRNEKEGPLHDIDNNGHLEDSRELEENPCTVDDHHSKNRKGNLQRAEPPRSYPDANLPDGGPRPTATSSDNSVRKKGRERVIPEEPGAELGRQEDCIQVDPKSSDNALGEDNRTAKKASPEISDQETAKLLNRKGNLQRAVPPRSCPDANLPDGGPRPTAKSSDNSVRKKGRERVIPEDCIRVNPKSSDDAFGEGNRTAKKASPEISDQEAAELLNNFTRASDDVTDNSNHSKRSQSRGKKCTYTYPAIPQLKRRRVPWTAEEEEMLKEGVQKLSSASDFMPWRMILDYGRSVFWKGRTPGDLKDKWRNMCKAKA